MYYFLLHTIPGKVKLGPIYLKFPLNFHLNPHFLLIKVGILLLLNRKWELKRELYFGIVHK